MSARVCVCVYGQVGMIADWGRGGPAGVRSRSDLVVRPELGTTPDWLPRPASRRHVHTYYIHTYTLRTYRSRPVAGRQTARIRVCLQPPVNAAR